MQVRNHHDLWSGIMFMAFGLLFMVFSRQYQMGTAAKMGPGYFPTVLGGLLFVLGLAIGATAYSKGNREAKLAPFGWRENGLVLLSVLIFAGALGPLGIVISIVLLVFVAAAASHEFSVRDTTLAAIFLLILSYLVFVKGLELQFPVWPKFLTN
ncbi:MAG: tripartite tricarboxylate transporter TctB family protein [Burkholderiaceae bacterium]